MVDISTNTETGPSGLVSRLITGWALLGGLSLFGVVLINTLSVIGTRFGYPIPGDFELTEIGICIAAFCFLPYCQLTGANVTADIFTSKASPRAIAMFAFASAIIALVFMLVLMWRMYAGMLDQKAYEYMTTILQIPTWIVFIPILISLALTAIAALMTLRDQFQIIR